MSDSENSSHSHVQKLMSILKCSHFIWLMLPGNPSRVYTLLICSWFINFLLFRCVSGCCLTRSTCCFRWNCGWIEGCGWCCCDYHGWLWGISCSWWGVGWRSILICCCTWASHECHGERVSCLSSGTHSTGCCHVGYCLQISID